MTNPALKAWHRPRVVTVQANGPFRAFTLLTLFDGRVKIVPSTPTVTNALDVERLVTAIGDAIAPMPDHDFTTSLLCRYARASEGFLHDVVRNKSNAQVAKLLEKIVGRTFDGVTIVRVKRRWFVIYA